MKTKPFILLTLVIALISCKQQTTKKEAQKLEAPTKTTIAEKIAEAHGFNNWKNVNEISFTFAEKRHWLWNTKTNEVTLFTEKDTISYNRKQVDSLSAKTDAAFVNDKFWLLIPFQLVWDKSASISEVSKEASPINKTLLQKISITYASQGGYTPGDAYDIYFDSNYIIREWVFRRGNQKEASLANTFEDYNDYNGIKIALSHKKESGDWNLKFTNVSVK
ncbi:hypothetical protein PK35_06695 [Tamlana nanhaiensis]|uniref:Selenophosphate synthetase n=1 Tax=Neotamlana nanhaiensis TaxID=1382798 RepID=A0A0D7W489_9FLAO|nr:hypothetical protein [Tamlana nanhaiensis]KJD33528.1 hypothetical protein PK35_06695 [Tamlana nanhaiensis]